MVGVVTESSKFDAATATAKTNVNCAAIAPFYYEIGNQNAAVLISGSTGDGSVGRKTNVAISSSSQWMFGAYVLQKLNGVVDPVSDKFLKLSSGYSTFGNTSCSSSSTVLACQTTASNSTYTVGNDNKFYYSGGHFQKWGVDNNLGALTNAQLVAEYRTYLGSDLNFTFASPQLSGGITTNAETYALFLRKMMSSQLLMGAALGKNAICTLPSNCPDNSVSSPVPLAWTYSYGHWVESDATGDGSFSSPGLYGFYPWISADKKYYGIISRSFTGSGTNELAAGWASHLCGKAIRKAYFSGVVQ